MATPTEILNARLNKPGVSKPVLDVFDTTQGLTEDIYGANVMEAFGKGVPAWLQGAEVDAEPTVPTLDVILSKLGIKAEDDPTGEKAARKFVEDFSKKQSTWKDKVMRDPAWGKRGWDTVVDMFKKTSKDLMDADIAKAREKVMEGDGAWEKAASTIGSFMFPRIKQAGVEGRDPTPSEIARDIGANAAYAVPVGRVSKILTKGAPALARAAAGTASQFAAPAAVAVSDYALDENYDTGDLETDILTGGLTNLGVNRVLGPAIGRGMGTLAGKVSVRMPPSVRAILEGAATPQELAEAKVAQAGRTASQAGKGFAPGNLREGVSTSVSAEELANAKGIQEIAEASKKELQVGKAKLKPSEILGTYEATGKFKQKDESDVLGSLVQQLQHPGTAPTAGNLKFSKEFKEGAKKYSKILEQNPELKSLFAPKSRFAVGNVAAPIEAYAVNQWGSSQSAPAAAAGAAFGIDVKAEREENAKRKEKEQSQGAISRVLESAAGLTDDDRKYLKMVRENPDMLRFSQDSKFKSWLLERGHRLLQGTPAHRPLWEVR